MNNRTLREKIGQMLIFGFEGSTFNESTEIAKYIEMANLGGVILFDYNYQTQAYNKNILSPSQVAKLNTELQKHNLNCDLKLRRKHLPLLISTDYEGGQVNRLHPRYGFPEIPSALDMAKYEQAIKEKYTSLMASTLNYTGSNLNYDPMLDLNVNPDNPVIGQLKRSFSRNTECVIENALLYAKAFSNKGIISVIKHFPGHGSSTTDSHKQFVDVTNTWQSEELVCFKKFIENFLLPYMVMTGHLINRTLDPNGLPATLSKVMINDLLRNQCGFEGVVVSDDMQMTAIRDHFEIQEALKLAINAGVDMFIFGNQLRHDSIESIIDAIELNIHQKAISESRIEQSFKRIVTLKSRVMEKHACS